MQHNRLWIFWTCCASIKYNSSLFYFAWNQPLPNPRATCDEPDRTLREFQLPETLRFTEALPLQAAWAVWLWNIISSCLILFFFSSCLILHLWVGGDTNASTAIGRWRRAKHNDLTIWGHVTTQGSRNLLLSLGSRLWKTSGFASCIWGDVWFKLMAASNSGPSERWPCSPPTRKLLCTEDGFWGIWISWASFHLWMGSLLGE